MTIHYKWPSIRTKMDYKRGAPSRDTIPPTWFWMSSLAYSQLCGRISAKPNQFSPSTSCSSRFSGGSITILQYHHKNTKQYIILSIIVGTNTILWCLLFCQISVVEYSPGADFITVFTLFHFLYIFRADLTHLYCQCPSPKRQLSLFTRSCCPLPFHFCLASWNCLLTRGKAWKELRFIHVLQTQ